MGAPAATKEKAQTAIVPAQTTTRPVVTTEVDLDKYEALQSVKESIVECVKKAANIHFEMARLFRRIQDERLYEGELNPDTSKPYRTMQEYEPHLMREMRQEWGIAQFEARTVRDYLFLDKVIVGNALATEDEVMEIGPSHFIELRSSLAYNSRTGVIDENPPEGRIGRAKAEEIIDLIKEGSESGTWSLQSTEHTIAEATAKKIRTLLPNWALTDKGTYRLVSLRIFEDGERVAEATHGYGMTEELATWINRRLGNLGNLGDLINYANDPQTERTARVLGGED